MKKMRKYLAALMVLALFVGMLPLTSTAASAAESDHVVANDDPYPEGITLDLFDYWLDDQEASDQSNPAGWQDLGINKGETLKFGAGMDKIDGVAAYNKWTNSAKPYNGIVEKTLGSDGYPQLDQNTTGSSGSLAYLFSGSAHDGKASYTNVGGLLQQDDEGYFYYDSTENFAAFDTSTDRFTLYDTWGVQTGGQSPDGQFFPFNTGEEVFETQGDSLVQKDGLTSTDASINHYFGMHMTTRFQQPKNGLSPSDDKTPVTYAFSGDDDVWI